METILENPVPIYAVGAVLATLCGLAFLARRNVPSLLALGCVVMFTLLLAVTEYLVVTEREQIEDAVAQLIVALEANDLPGVLALIHPASGQARSDAETLMPLARISDAGATSLRVEVDKKSQPMVAVGEFRGRVDGTHVRSGARLFYFDRVLANWKKKDGRWLLSGYTPMWRDRPINPVESMRGNRPVP